MTSSPTSAARQLARTQGLARMSAITLGVSAASVLGAVAIGVTLADSPSASAETSAKATAAAPRTSSDDADDGFWPQLQATLAPTTTDNSPSATSGGS